MSKNKPNCLVCKYRGTVTSNAHSCCRYPGNKLGTLDFFHGNNMDNMYKLNIRGNAHGIDQGWFVWPINFDPCWLENCDGYILKSNL